MVKKILLIGSAGYVKDWYAENGSKYLSAGFSLYALNNAWAVDPENLKVWLRAEDFFDIPTSLKPKDEDRNKWTVITRWNDVPFFYTNRRGGTMLLNALCHLMNEAFYNKHSLFIAIAGADQTYGGPKDWFYGTGTPDPMKFGKEFIQESLQHIKYASEKLGHTIVNVGEQAETLLPFARFSL
jgi:hypothetical protein